MRKIIFFGVLTCFSISVLAKAEYAPQKREQLPAALDDTYFGMGAGYTNIPFSNSNLINGFTANHFKNPTSGLNIYIGHYFNPYIAAEISLMRPIKWSYAYGVENPNDKHSIWVSVFGISARPTLPISKRINLYGIAGLGIESRHGFTTNAGTTVIPSQDLMTFLTGGGFSYAVTNQLHWDTGVEYALAQPTAHQPAITYVHTGFFYLFTKRHLPNYYDTQYIFHKNFIQVGTFSTELFNPSVNKYFTIGYLPIFWTGDVTAKDGTVLMYERNIFHTHQVFSFDVGTSASFYDSKVNNTAFETFSVFPDMRLWFIRSRLADFYFMYSLAGPTYITRKNIDNINTGGNFTFQDLLGIGMLLGKHKHFNMDFRIGHYSNGNLLPNNPGIQVPYTFSIGYAF